MITDEIVNAMEMMAEICNSDEQTIGMHSLIAMLCDFDEDEWIDMTAYEQYNWLEEYLRCPRRAWGEERV